MAGKIKGINIEIGGDTTGLDKALKNVNKSASDASKEIKEIDRALKFDPGNVVLLGQKQELLAKQVSNAKEKLETLKTAEEQVQKQFAEGKIGKEQYRAFQREVEVTQNVLKGYENKLENVNQALAGNGSATDSNISKLKTLQSEQQQLHSELQKVDSQYKLQESALGKNASEADKLALAEQKVANQSNILNLQIRNLERQLDLTKKEYGENSIQANKMEAELNNAKSTLNSLNNELRDTSSASNNAQNGMEAVGNTIRAEALANVGEKMGELSQKMVDLGWAGMEASAEMQASNAQFSTVFGDMEAVARGSLDSISSDLDIVPERLQGSFTQIAAFAKTSGMETAEALGLSERATRAAADGAAFYDKSIEEVTENLQSFLKGNFENDAALGISATETTRNAKANELYGKSFNELSEAQKQLTLLQMVEDGQKAAGAFGQATREADGFENVLGNLKQSGENALASLGDPLLEAMIPVFQLLGKVLQQIAGWFANLSAPIQQVIVIFGAVLTMAGFLLPVFLALSVAAAAMGTTVGGLIASFLPIIGIIAGIAAAIALLVVGIKYLWENNEAFRTAVIEIWNAIMSVIDSVIQQISAFVMSIWGTLVAWWTDNQELIKSSAEIVWNAIMSVISTVMTALQPLIQAAWSNIQLVIETVWTVIKTVVETAVNTILGIVKAVMQAINGDWYGAWETMRGVVDGLINAIKSIIETILTAIQQYIQTTWQAIVTYIQFVLNMIFNIVSTIWNSILSFIGNIVTSISNTISNVFNGISSTISGVMSGIFNTVSSVWNGIKDTITNTINGARDAVSNAINAIKGFFNFEWSLPRPKLPRFDISGGEAPWGFGGKGSLPSIDITWFAKGGILTKPTIFGMNSNGLMGGGEAGKEAILPLNESTLGMVADHIMSTVKDKIVVNVEQPKPQPIILNIDGKTFAQLIVGHVSDAQAQRIQIIEGGGTVG